MAHFFDSCAQVLSPNGRVKISVIDGQETRWDIGTQARRSGLNLVKCTRFREEMFEGYVCKRNKNSESFKNIHTKRHTSSEMRSCSWEFSREASCFDGYIAALTRKVLGGMEEVIFTGPVPIETKNKSLQEPQTGKLDQISSMTNGMKSLKVDRKSQKKVAPADLKCPQCSKILSCTRAWHQHVHMVT
jgi:Domain of unknown function (DUF2431)